MFAGSTGKIIGVKGAKIQEIRTASRVTDIKMPAKNEDGPRPKARELVTLALIGKGRAIKTARELIQAVVDEWVCFVHSIPSSNFTFLKLTCDQHRPMLPVPLAMVATVVASPLRLRTIMATAAVAGTTGETATVMLIPQRVVTGRSAQLVVVIPAVVVLGTLAQVVVAAGKVLMEPVPRQSCITTDTITWLLAVLLFLWNCGLLQHWHFVFVILQDDYRHGLLSCGVYLLFLKWIWCSLQAYNK